MAIQSDEMARKLPAVVVVFAAIAATLYLLCAMALLSSIIAWISLEFDLEYAAPLAFTVGLLSLAAGIVAILMVGISRLKQLFGFIFLMLTVLIMLTSIGLGVLFGLEYIGDKDDLVSGNVCDDCDHQGMDTQLCVDQCSDECCFTDKSDPLAIIFLAGAGTALIASVVGLGVVVLHLYFAFRSGVPKRR